MEIRVRYIAVGLFVLVIGLSSLAFALWIQNKGSIRSRLELVVRFERPAQGLRTGAPVTFNGVRVGDVTRLVFDAADLSAVDAHVSVDRDTPITATTKATLETQGVLGAVYVSLTGGDKAQLLVSQGGTPVLLASDRPSLSQDAHETLAGVRALVTDNAPGIHDAINNIQAFSAILSRNSDRIESILTSLQRTLASPDKDAKPAIYDLPAPTKVEGFEEVAAANLVVNDPTTSVIYDTQRLLVEKSSGEISPQAVSWPDSIPKLLQRRVVQTFDNVRYKSASSPLDNPTPEYQLSLDIREFQIVEGLPTEAKVSFNARLLDRDGKLLDSRLIEATAPVAGPSAEENVRAVRSAFTDALKSLVLWYRQAVSASP